MSIAQIIIIGIGILIVLSSLDLTAIKEKEKQVPVPVTPVPAPLDPKDELVSIVQKWQDLKSACEKNKLAEATAKLDEIFPMLIKVEKS